MHQAVSESDKAPEILVMLLMLCASPSHRDHFCNVRDQKLDGRKALIGNEASFAPGKGSVGLHRWSEMVLEER